MRSYRPYCPQMVEVPLLTPAVRRSAFGRAIKRKGRPLGTAPVRRVRARSALLERQAPEALVELRDAAAFLDLLLAAGPCRMTRRIDFQGQRVAFAAPGGARLELGAVGHLDLDHVVIGMRIGLHGVVLACVWPVPTGRQFRGSGAH